MHEFASEKKVFRSSSLFGVDRLDSAMNMRLLIFFKFPSELRRLVFVLVCEVLAAERGKGH